MTLAVTTPAVLSPADLPRYGELPETFTAQVEWADIREGIACSTHECPIARAVLHWLWLRGIRVANVSVGRGAAEIVLDWNLPHLTYLHDAEGFIDGYDDGRAVEPRTVMFRRLGR